jgi:hypothetical protein
MMATAWVVTTAGDSVALGAGGSAAVTFTVTNSGPVLDRAVFDVVPSDGAERSWFTVEQPQRSLSAGASVSYLVQITVPASTPPGDYSMQGLVYSADTAPEESSVLSNRVRLTVGGGGGTTRPWWLLAVAALVVVVLGVVAFLVFSRDREPDPPDIPLPTGVLPTPTGPPGDEPTSPPPAQPEALAGHQVVSSDHTVPAGGFLRNTSTCPAGTVALGGGASVIRAGTGDFRTILQESTPGTVGGGTNSLWLAALTNNGNQTRTIRIHAVCAQESP